MERNKTGVQRAIELAGKLANVLQRIASRSRDRHSPFIVKDDYVRLLSMLAMLGRFDKARKAAGINFQFRDIRAKTASETGDLCRAGR